MTKGKLIGLYSPFPQVGKSTAADRLQAGHGYIKMPMASVMKQMLMVLVESLGYEHYIAREMFYGSMKNSPIPELDDKTSRDLMVTLGTDWGRNLVYSHIWLNAWTAKVQRALDVGQNIVVDDIRFTNEANVVKQLGGIMWRVDKKDEDRVSNPDNATECSLEDFKFDSQLISDHTEDGLERYLDAVDLLGIVA